MDSSMDIKALQDALQFLDESDSIVLQVPYYRDIPYLKREIFRIMGEPDRNTPNSLHYVLPNGRKRISLIPVTGAVNREDLGNDLFYVGYDNQWEWLDHRELVNMPALGITEARLDLFKTMKLPVNDMLYSIVKDGYHLVRAWWELDCLILPTISSDHRGRS